MLETTRLLHYEIISPRSQGNINFKNFIISIILEISNLINTNGINEITTYNVNISIRV